ncbi:hypothetical protein HFN89_07055 [Rhizobium laguerreae]|nr:hypothetical protein [Rhizobium laguerreae]
MEAFIWITILVACLVLGIALVGGISEGGTAQTTANPKQRRSGGSGASRGSSDGGGSWSDTSSWGCDSGDSSCGDGGGGGD